MKRMENFCRSSTQPIARALSKAMIQPMKKALPNGASPTKLLHPIGRILSNRVSEDHLQPGDHIYSWRQVFFYAHHGIYIGDGKVIHFTRMEGDELTGTVLDKIGSINGSVPSYVPTPCAECGEESGTSRGVKRSGVICSCMKCFLAGGHLYRYDYGTSAVNFLLNLRSGTCTLALSDPPQQVLHRANYLLHNGFKCYNLFKSNCEDFAMYCKTGLFVVRGNAVGGSGQAATVVGAPMALVMASPLYVAGPWGMAVMSLGMYSLSRYVGDIKNRPGVRKIPVEDLVTIVKIAMTEYDTTEEEER